jgi:hypothetical protein
MWTCDVDVPEALIDAHREGDLVIFVGGGASRDPPSGLPDFGGLAADIWAESFALRGELQPERPADEVIGDLKEHHHVTPAHLVGEHQLQELGMGEAVGRSKDEPLRQGVQDLAQLQAP